MKSFRNPFIKRWMLFNYLGWSVGMLVGYILDLIFVSHFFWERRLLDIVLEPILLSIPLGISIGTMQGMVLRPWRSLFSSWTGISILGSVIAAIINIWLFGNDILGEDISGLFLPAILVGCIVAIFQTVFLRKLISKPVRWFFLHLFGFIGALIISLVIFVMAFMFADPIIKVLIALNLSFVVWSRDLVLILFILLTFPLWLAIFIGLPTGNILYKTFGNTQMG